jgi:hypothetical protein
MKTQHPPERRVQDRQPVSWPIHASGTGSHMIGAEVCDISRNGVFVHPNEDEPLPVVGSRLMLTVFPHGAGQGVSAVGTVRWLGPSRTHRCRGLGILVERSGPFARLGRLAADEAASSLG